MTDAVDEFLASRPFSDSYAKNLRSTLREAERVTGKPVLEWKGGMDDALKYKAHLEGRLRNRSPSVKWGRVMSFFAWAATTGKAAVNVGGKAAVVAGVEMEHREDPKMPTLTKEGYARLDTALEELAHEKAPKKSTAFYHVSERRQEEWKARVRKWEYVLRGTRLQWRHGYRGGEVFTDEMGRPLTTCDCAEAPGEACPRRPVPHDIRFAPDGLTFARVKGEPMQIRFSEEVLTEEEAAWLKDMAESPVMALKEVDTHLKLVQVREGIELIDRKGRPVPIALGPLTTHTLRRTLSREINKAKVPEQTHNKKLHWTAKSMQSRRYGEPSPVEVDDQLKEVIDITPVKRAIRKREEEATTTKKGKPAPGPGP